MSQEIRIHCSCCKFLIPLDVANQNKSMCVPCARENPETFSRKSQYPMIGEASDIPHWAEVRQPAESIVATRTDRNL